jgi:hypothetical protein
VFRFSNAVIYCTLNMNHFKDPEYVRMAMARYDTPSSSSPIRPVGGIRSQSNGENIRF